jgi:hypothetical protein
VLGFPTDSSQGSATAVLLIAKELCEVAVIVTVGDRDSELRQKDRALEGHLVGPEAEARV